MRSAMSQQIKKIFYKMTQLFIVASVLTILAGGFLVLAQPTYAQDEVTSGLETVGDTSGLSNTDIKVTIAKLIRTFLTILGIIAVIIIMYGGFVWMTAGGSEEKIESAKKILINGVIGLFIILMSYSITTFVLSSILGATGGSSGSSSSSSGSSTSGLGGGSVTSFSVSAFSPEGEVSIRNIKLQITFSRKIEESTVSGNVVVTNTTTGDEIDGELSISGNKVSFVPSSACPSPNEDRYCFDENTQYSVEVTEDIESTSGKSLDCSAVSCESSFTSGDLVDVEDPSVSLSYPDNGDRISVDSNTLVQVFATDDSEVSTADFYGADEWFDSVSATGDDLSDVIIESTWYTDNLEEGTRYTVEATVEDIAGNTDTDSIRILAEAVHCSNGSQDEDEDGEDCGGVDCGSCDGSSCSVDEDCSSGTCEDGTCISYPEISSISPEDGAVGTYVTVAGDGFGSSGSVYFIDENGDNLEADVPSCADWSDSEIVIEVPEGASDGPITVETSSGYSDSTDDDNGIIIDDFDVNDTVRPSLCSISPETGEVGAAITISGFNFGDSQSDSIINLDDDEIKSYTSWSNTDVAATVPVVSTGEYYSVAMTVDGVSSNELSFGVETSENSNPVISYASPEEGGEGQYVTIYGTDFGSSTGTVYFENNDNGYSATGSADFPDACDTDFWSDSQIIIIIPSAYTNGDSLEIGDYNLYITTADGDESDAIDFVITDDDPTPGICKIDPDSGAAGDEVVIYGEKFGSSEGIITFYNGQSATISDWSSSEISTTVPIEASTGPLILTSNQGEESNETNFEISSEDSNSETTPNSGSYAWYFSTGEVPETPELLVDCDYDSGIISSVPNKEFTSDVCTLAIVRGTFNTLMDTDTLSVDNITVAECSDSSCDSTENIEGGEIETSSSTSATSFTWTYPTNTAGYNGGVGFKNSTTYQVTVLSDVESESGGSMDDDASWIFTTGSANDNCDIEEVVVSPGEDTIDEEGGTTEFEALPSAQCQVFSGESYQWDWSLDPNSYASVSAGSCEDVSDDSCAVATAINEGDSVIYAEEKDSGITGDGDLIVNYTDPYVSSYWPDCSEACVNASVGASFNIAMSSDVTDGITLYKCENELCVSLDNVDITASCTDEDTNDNGVVGCSEIQVASSDNLDKNTFYRVIISSDVTSRSGLSLTKSNYGDDFSWTFSTKDDDSLCSVNRVDVTPDSATVNAVGEMQSYYAQPYGETDSCSTAGQKLDGYDYNWEWSDPYDDEGVALMMSIGSSLADVDINSIPDGCSTSCLSSGSSSYSALCGNKTIETGEDCDDGNTTDGDGCSSSCLREGANGSYGTCSDGILDRIAVSTTIDQGGGEDCDDGNTTDGDGCSSSCLNEGSKYVDSTCGNGSIAYASDVGGEDCDDGNTKSGDGCSSQCLNEGSTDQTEITAECGDGDITEPYETCDDGNTTDGDGCSSSCLREGSGYGTCGDEVVDQDPNTSAGEDCDDNDDEGCVDCLYQGSSLDYSDPSVCGDGNVGTGEIIACEDSTSGDGNIDPAQVAYIVESAPEYVDTDTELAETTIKASYDEEYDTAKLYLECSAENDSDCTTGYGPADNKCCMERPEISNLNPTGTDVCRNVAFYAVFNTKMDIDTFVYNTGDEDINNVYIKYSGIDCPSDYTSYAYGQVKGKTIFARIINRVKSLFNKVNAQSVGDCLLPITGITQSAQDDGSYKVNFHYDILLEDTGEYILYVKGGTLDDEDRDGVLSYYGVEMDGDEYSEFTTGTDICTLDVVEVDDVDEDSPNLFTATNEEHDFVATPYSYQSSSKEEIQAITDVYDWEWTSWQSDDDGEILSSKDEDDTSDISNIVYVAQGANGDVDVAASATIVADIVGDSVGDTVADSESVTALLCENTWPELTEFPFIDDPSSTLSGVEKGIGWMNFSMYYCRDDGESGISDDLGSLNIMQTNASGSSDVIKEYFFPVLDDGVDSGDAIGIRVVTNSGYQSPLMWYQEQGFAGSPSVIEVDGYQAVQDGRTVYIAVPNQVLNTIYSNIFIVSYNEGASVNTIDIFNQLLDSINFNTNNSLHTTALCYDGSQYSNTKCESDLDCESGSVCGDDKAKLRRDMKRLTDISDLVSYIDTYKVKNSGETPQLVSGTYVAPIGASAWSSWDDVLAVNLGVSIASDPVNDYKICNDTADYTFDAETCVDQTKGVYMCPEGSRVYNYRAFGNEGYYLTGELEYLNADWFYDIDNDLSDDNNVLIGASSSALADGFNNGFAFCDGTEYGASTTCGDGVIGGSEICEIGETSSEFCDYDEDGVVDDGSVITECNDTCSGYTISADTECSAFECGNGLIEDGEDCDDGSSNGSYGYCGADCTYNSSFYCGDGTLAGSETCDCGEDTLSTVNSAYGGSVCSQLNGEYDFNAYGTCAWDCSGPASYCGDGEVDSAEECDGSNDTWSGELCSGGDNNPCESDSDCNGYSCGTSSFHRTSILFESCPYSTVCLEADDTGDIGIECETDADCGSTSGLCSNTEYQTTRTRTCADDGENGDLCTWNERWTAITCKAEIGSCGDGEVDEGEECDDGNDDSTDSCTNECLDNICGDGYVYDGEEQCDEGGDNGVACSSAYESTCSYCNSSCQTVSSSGNFCGDGEISGSELCDGNEVAYHYFNSSNGIYDTCTSVEYDSGATTTDDDENSYSCSYVGICNGESDNGDYCTSSSDCSSEECVFPECSDECDLMCPYTYSSDDLMMKTNLVGAGQQSDITLSSFSSSVGSPSLTYGSAATLYIPECRVATAITADVEYNFDLPPIKVMFVTDLSTSMDNAMDDGTRLSITKEVLNDSIDTLFDEVDSDISVGLTTMLSNNCGAIGYTADDGTNIDDVDTFFHRIRSRGLLYFVNEYYLSKLQSEIDTYFACGGTYTFSGLEAAYHIFEDNSDEDDRKVVVLLSDGDWSTTSADDKDRNPQFMACKLKDELDVELFTVGIFSGTASSITNDGTECDEFRYSDGSYYEDWDTYLSEGPSSYSSASSASSSSSSSFQIACGNGFINSGEDCDDSGESATCDDDCTWADCGDGLLNQTAGESCDDGLFNGLSTSSCKSDCTLNISTPLSIINISNQKNQFVDIKNNLISFVQDKISDISVQIMSGVKFALAARPLGPRDRDGSYSSRSSTSGTECSDGYESLSIAQEMACWSSGNPNDDYGIDYAFNGSTADELAAAYEEIINDLLGVKFTYIVDSMAVSGIVREGKNVSLPWPEGFECDEENETEIPIRVSFDGDGSIGISNVSINYCSP